jgi:hypothetical protein
MLRVLEEIQDLLDHQVEDLLALLVQASKDPLAIKDPPVLLVLKDYPEQIVQYLDLLAQ